MNQTAENIMEQVERMGARERLKTTTAKREVVRSGYFTDRGSKRLSGGRVDLELHISEGFCPRSHEGEPVQDAVKVSIELDANGEPLAGQFAYDSYSFKGGTSCYTIKSFSADGKLANCQKWVLIPSGETIDFLNLDFSKTENPGPHACLHGFTKNAPIQEESYQPTIADMERAVRACDDEKTRRRNEGNGRAPAARVAIASASSSPAASAAFIGKFGNRLSNGKIVLVGNSVQDLGGTVALDGDGIPRSGQSISLAERYTVTVVAESGETMSKQAGCVLTCGANASMIDLGADLSHPHQPSASTERVIKSQSN